MTSQDPPPPPQNAQQGQHQKPTQPFSSWHTPELPELIEELQCSFVLSTYQAGKVMLVGSDGGKITLLPRNFAVPMGMAVDGRRMAIATKGEIVFMVNDQRLAPSYPKKPNHYDALFVPRSIHFTGPCSIHDMAFGEDGLVGVNTAFSCLFRLDDVHSFLPTWKPPFISQYAGEDRCHLNGMALVDGKPRYVTALGTSDEQGGWREDKLKGGVLVDIESDEIILRDLPMPHSPRVYDGKLYMLLSATGEVVVVDVDSGSYEVINRISGFVRGMTRWGDYVFVASSKLRKTHTFGDLELAKDEDIQSGFTVIHLRTGSTAGQFRFVRTCDEIYDIHVLPGIRRPGIVGLMGNEETQLSVTTPEATFWTQPKQGPLQQQ